MTAIADSKGGGGGEAHLWGGGGEAVPWETLANDHHTSDIRFPARGTKMM